MQLKLLNFHKMLANLSTSLVGAFIPLIIYEVTGNLIIAFLYLTIYEFFRIVVNVAFKKLFFNYPQLMLLIRVVPLLLFSIFVILLDYWLWGSIVAICIFKAFSDSMNACSKEIIYNYSSLNKNSNSIGITRIFEQVGTIAAFIIGGFLLDINKTIVVIISIVLYLISVIPLLMYYIKSKSEKSFNKDATSNAIIASMKNTVLETRRKKIIKEMIFDYAMTYFVFAFIDLFSTVFNLYIFINNNSVYAIIGILSAVFNACYLISSYIFGAINDKKDLTTLVIISNIAVAILVGITPFISNLIGLFIIFGLIGFILPIMSIYVLNRMMLKSRILGISNETLMARENGCCACYTLGRLLCVLSPVSILFYVGFYTISFFHLISSFAIPKNEERTRKLLVDFLQCNEINNSLDK